TVDDRLGYCSPPNDLLGRATPNRSEDLVRVRLGVQVAPPPFGVLTGPIDKLRDRHDPTFDPLGWVFAGDVAEIELLRRHEVRQSSLDRPQSARSGQLLFLVGEAAAEVDELPRCPGVVLEEPAKLVRCRRIMQSLPLIAH